MITKIELTNFKSHAHTVIEPGRVTALVGPNGCGKTSLLQSIHFLTRLINEPWDQVFKGHLDFDYLSTQMSSHAEITLQGWAPILKENWELSCAYNNDPDGNCIASVHWKLGDEVSREVLSKGESLSQVSEIGLAVPYGFYFKASSTKLAEPSYSEKIPPVVESDGEGLASVIAHLVLDAPARVRAIEDSLRNIVPTVKKFGARFAKVKVKEKKLISVGTAQVAYDEEREVTGQELFFDTLSANSLPAHAMSDGTLLVLGLLTLLHSSDLDVILLDDIEAGLHPLAQRQLMQTLKTFAEKHDRQIILTSHSPYIIDELPAEDVWVMATDKEGISRCNRLSNHPDKDRALEVLTTGEFLSAEGEEWVIDNPFSAETVNA